MKRPGLFVLALAFAGGVAAQSEGQAFSLKEAIEYAVKHSPSHQNAMLDQQSAVHRKKEITGSGLPQIGSSVDLKRFIEIPTSLIPAMAFNPAAGPDEFAAVQFGTKYNTTAGFSGSQLIFSSDYIFGLKASSEFLALSRINLDRSRADVAAQVSKAYYNVIINRDRIKLLDANIAQMKKLYSDTKAYNGQGLVEDIDVERLEVLYNNLLTQRENTGRLVGLTESMLKFQMGYKLRDPITLTDSLDTQSETFQDYGNGVFDFSQRPELLLAQSQKKLLDLDLKRWKWGYLPTVAAYGVYQWNTQRQRPDFFTFDDRDPLKQWYKIVFVGATINFGIFDGFQRHHRIQQARIAAVKAENDIRNLELATELEATMASINYSNAYAMFGRQKKNMELAAHVYEVAQRKYESGIGSNIEVVTAETSMREAQTNYYNAFYDMLVARIDFKKATGTLMK